MKKFFAVLLSLGCIASMLPFITFAEEPTAAPVAWYDFEDEDNLGKDKTGNGNDLLVEGEPVQEEGPSGSSLYFDGVSALYASTDENGVDFVDAIDMTGTRQLTIAYWVQNETIDYETFQPGATWRRIISNGHDGGAKQESTGSAFGGFAMLSLADNYIVPTVVKPAIMVDGVEGHDGNMSGNTSCYAFEEGKWFFIVWSIDAATGQAKYYVNGSLIYDQVGVSHTSNGGTKLSNVARPFSIANNTSWDAETGDFIFNHAYIGNIDEVMVFDSIISDADIAYYMEATGVDLPEETTTEPVTTEPKVTTDKNDDTTEEKDDTTVPSSDKAEDTSAKDTTAEEPAGVPTGLIIGIVAAVIVIGVVVAIVVVKKKK